MGSYLAIVRIQAARRLIMSAFPGRLAYSMISLGIYFKVQQSTHSISLAGLAVGLNGISGALTAGARGAVADRFGLKWPLSIFIPCYALLILIFNSQSNGRALVICAFIMGFSAPPINLSVRPMWKITVPPDLLRTAFAVDTAMMNLVGIFGPLLVTSIALSSHPTLALQLCAGFISLSGVMLVSLPVTRKWQPEKKEIGTLPIWKVPAMRLLALEGVCIGIGMGAFNIAIPAFATLKNVPQRAGQIFAVMAVFTVIGGLLAGLISRRTSSLRAFRRIYLTWFLLSLPLAFTNPDWTMFLTTSAISLMSGAMQVFYWEITEAVRPKGSAVAALGWLWSVEGTCTALGVTLGGFISDHYSPKYTLAITTLAIGAGLLVINVGKNILKQADRIPTKEEDELAMEKNSDITR